MQFGTLPDEVWATVQAACRDLQGPVAVRSSATAEDLPAASFTGRQRLSWAMGPLGDAVPAAHGLAPPGGQAERGRPGDGRSPCGRCSMGLPRTSSGPITRTKFGFCRPGRSPHCGSMLHRPGCGFSARAPTSTGSPGYRLCPSHSGSASRCGHSTSMLLPGDHRRGCTHSLYHVRLNAWPEQLLWLQDGVPVALYLTGRPQLLPQLFTRSPGP